jgi:hypothetical protein
MASAVLLSCKSMWLRIVAVNRSLRASSSYDPNLTFARTLPILTALNNHRSMGGTGTTFGQIQYTPTKYIILAAPNLVQDPSRLIPSEAKPTIDNTVDLSSSLRNHPLSFSFLLFSSNLTHTNTSQNNKRQLVQIRKLVLVRRLCEVADLGDVDGGVAEVVLCK